MLALRTLNPVGAAADASPLQVSLIRSEAPFMALRQAWNAVARAAETPSVFLSHEWFSAAWAWRRLDCSLHIMLAREGGRLVGALPLILKRDARGTRRLEFLAVPDTQSCDLVTTPADAARVVDAFATVLCESRDWDVMHLDCLAPGATALTALAPALGRMRPVEQGEAGLNYFIELDGDWNAYYNSRSRSLKKANNLATNRLTKAGTVRLEWTACDERAQTDVQHALEHVIGISQRSWKRDTGTSLDQPGPQAFIKKLSADAGSHVSLWLAYLDDIPAAMEYQLIDARSVYALRADFDTAFEEVSPGSYLFRHLLQTLFQKGLKRYYMGRGNNTYKTRWANEGEPVRRLLAYNATWRGNLAWFTEAVLKPRVRRLRKGLGRGMFRRESSDNDGGAQRQ